MAPKKKSTSASARQTEDTQALAVVPAQNQTSTKEGEVEDIASGHFEVQLDEMGVPAEDVVAYQRIEAKLAEVTARARQVARAVQPSTS
jgi:hypothetical protein